MRRRSGFRYPRVLLAATIEERSRLGVREAYYIAKNIKRDGEEFVKGDFSDQEKTEAATIVCTRIIHEEYISSVLESLLQAYHKSEFYKNNKPLKIRIVFPMPATSKQSANALSPVFVAILENKLREALRRKDPHDHMHASIECDVSVRSIAKVGRTVSLSENVSKEEKLIDFVGLLARQPLFSGAIEREAIYLLADDSVRRQTTFANLAAFIDGNGGTIGAATALIGVPESTKMQTDPASLKLLQDILWKRNIPNERVNEVLADPYIFGDLNLFTGAEEKNTLTNLETLLLASYFGDAQDKKEFENVLELAGSSRDEQGVVSDYLKLSRLLDVERPSGTVEEFREILVKEALKQRSLRI